MILCSRKRPLSLSRTNQHFNETAHCVNGLKSLALSIPDVKTLIDHLLIWRRGYKVVWREADIVVTVLVRGALKNR